MKASVLLALCLVFAVLVSSITQAAYTVPGLDAEIEGDVFDTELLGYSPSDAAIFARLSAAAYCAQRGTNGLDKWSCKACQDSGIPMDRVSKFLVATTDMSGYVGYSKAHNRIFLVFRGSSNIANWMTNLDFGHVDYDFAPGIKVHGGFMKAYKFARPIIMGILNSFFYEFPNAELSISGHSLAGAIASHALADFASGTRAVEVFNLAGIQFARNGSPYDDEIPFSHTELLGLQSAGLQTNLNLLSGNVLGGKFNLHFPMYTFGAPRIGDPAWAAWFKQITSGRSLYRVVHNEDPVPHLPPMSMGFKHFPTEVYYNQDESHYVICDANQGEDAACSNQHWLPANIDNHLVYLGYRLGSSPDAC